MDDAEESVLNILDVLQCLGDNTRPVIEGSLVSRTGVLDMGIINSTEDSLEIAASVMQASHCDEAPHRVDVLINFGRTKKTVKCKCLCIGGGAGQCKHVGAVILLLTK